MTYIRYDYMYSQLRKKQRAHARLTRLKALWRASFNEMCLNVLDCFCKYRLTHPKAPLSNGVQS